LDKPGTMSRRTRILSGMSATTRPLTRSVSLRKIMAMMANPLIAEAEQHLGFSLTEGESTLLRDLNTGQPTSFDSAVELRARSSGGS
jgi:hypothetical protein